MNQQKKQGDSITKDLCGTKEIKLENINAWE